LPSRARSLSAPAASATDTTDGRNCRTWSASFSTRRPAASAVTE
jgi:hypothetical protein